MPNTQYNIHEPITCPCPWPDDPVHTFCCYLFKILFNNILPSVPAYPRQHLSFSFLTTTLHALKIYLMQDTCHTSNPPWLMQYKFQNSSYAVFSSLLFFINFGQIFSPASCSLPPWNLTVCSSPNVKDQVSHSYKTTCKIMVPFNTYMFLDSRPGQKMLSWILASITAF